VGLAGDMGVYASLPTRIGIARTRQMLLMGNAIGADEALSIGLVDALAEPGSALAGAMDDAQKLADRPAGALAAVKQTLAVAPYTQPIDVLELEKARQVQLFDSDDFGEGVAAFREKRPPRFKSRHGLTQGAST
jgi:2-(1,2-epoxy-1,2-dihydrophenyl)acetyl-CoA isomerase